MDTTPADLRTWVGSERPEMDPPYRDYRYFWCPNLNSPALFWHVTEDMEEEIYRYPAAQDTDDFFYETEDECYQTDGTMSGNMEESEWFGALDPVNNELFWGPYSESWQTITDEEAEDGNGSDDEEWRRPPPINTSRSEWYYE